MFNFLNGYLLKYTMLVRLTKATNRVYRYPVIMHASLSDCKTQYCKTRTILVWLEAHV